MTAVSDAVVQQNGKPRSKQRRLPCLAATRLTEVEMAAVCAQARLRGLSVSAYIRGVVTRALLSEVRPLVADQDVAAIARHVAVGAKRNARRS